jgi:hypothetical protein
MSTESREQMLRARWEIRAFRNVERLADYKKIKARRQHELTRTAAIALRGRTRRWRSLLSEKNKTTIIAVGTVVIVFLTVALLVVALLLQKPLCQPFAGARIPLVSRAPPATGRQPRRGRARPAAATPPPGQRAGPQPRTGALSRRLPAPAVVRHQVGREYRTFQISALRQYYRAADISPCLRMGPRKVPATRQFAARSIP